MKNPKFEKWFDTTDMISDLQTLVDHYVHHYKTDYEIDKDTFLKAANGTEKDFIWILRNCGTQCENRRLAHILGTKDNYECEYFLPQEDKKAFLIHIEKEENGKISGCISPRNNQVLLEEIRENAALAKEVLVTPKDEKRGEPFKVSFEEYMNQSSFYGRKHGEFDKHYILYDAEELRLSSFLHEQTMRRLNAKHFSFETLLKKELGFQKLEEKADDLDNMILDAKKELTDSKSVLDKTEKVKNSLPVGR